jgi:hypothetical protein
MKTFLIASPAYRANGYNGGYYSVVVCKNDGRIKEIIGDHDILAKKYEFVHELQDVTFTDYDRSINVTECAYDVDKIHKQRKAFLQECKAFDEWHKAMIAFCEGDPYKYLYDDAKRGAEGALRRENKQALDEWKTKNPAPKRIISYYHFLNCNLD